MSPLGFEHELASSLQATVSHKREVASWVSALTWYRGAGGRFSRPILCKELECLWVLVSVGLPAPVSPPWMQWDD